MKLQVKRLVQRRAQGKSEYCQLHQDFDSLPHHVDHIIARKHQGSDEEENLCLACANCSLAKGSNISGRDPHTKKLTRLFHPREDAWDTHFAIGRTTVVVLNINQPERVALREALRRVNE
jgi:5-methylcytosine-specific restriction endonuclease McrA